MPGLTKQEQETLDRLVKEMWTEDALEAFLDNQDVLIRFNEWIGLALLYRQFMLFASLIQAVFSLGYMIGKGVPQSQFDVDVWANAIDEAFNK